MIKSGYVKFRQMTNQGWCFVPLFQNDTFWCANVLC